MPEAFLYCWTDKATNKLYVGVHKGSHDDGYVCSSKYLLEEYRKRPTDFTRQIVADGEYTDLLKLETVILTSIDAAHDPLFYNRHNGDGQFWQGPLAEITKQRLRKPKGKKRGPNSPERNRRISETMRGRVCSPEHKKAVSEAKKGKPFSETHKRALAEAARRRWERVRNASDYE